MECPYVEEKVKEAQQRASDEEVALETENLSEQIREAVKRVSEPAIQAEAPIDLPVEKPPRNLVTVLEDVLKVAPELEDSFRSLFESITYTAPEMMSQRWEEAAYILNINAQEHPRKIELIKIFNGK